MGVKKHEMAPDNAHQLNVVAAAEYIQSLSEHLSDGPSTNEIIKNCQDAVKFLARTSVHEERLWELLRSVEDYLLQVLNFVGADVRVTVINAIVDKFYSYTSDPQSDASPATSVVLIVLDEENNEMTHAANRLVQQGDNGPAGEGLRASLSCFYRWMLEWQDAPSLGDWTIAYIKALESNEKFEILVEVSIDNLSGLFMSMENVMNISQSEANVVFYTMASLRESTEALNKIAPHVGRVLDSLAADSGQWSRQVLQHIVDILTEMVDRPLEKLKREAQDQFKEKYAEVKSCLELHMASSCSEYLQSGKWRHLKKCPTTANAHPDTSARKVGILNLGNTCYMNSVMQALLVTRQFSTYVTLKMIGAPYWAKLAMLFAKMTYSVSTKLNPTEFFHFMKPPFFTNDNQHDSSEFLGYLFELLKSYEYMSELNFDYTRPPTLMIGRCRHVYQQHPSAASTAQSSKDRDNEPSEQGANLCGRALSPSPGSSNGGSGSVVLKRPHPDSGSLPLKKRVRIAEPTPARRESFVDDMFGGVLITRVQCVECHSSSLSRDMFRDLQLAFPEKPKGGQYNVQGLLEYYCSKERLSGDNRYYCVDCGGHRDAERSVLIETTPRHLILVLKNFKFEPKIQVQKKLMHSVFHNHAITLPTVRSQVDHATYSLYAAVIHDGTTLDSGHYYTLAKDNDQWYMFNDDVVTASHEGALTELSRACTPYILFYRRTDVEDCAAPSMDELAPALQESVMAHNKHYVESVRKLSLTRP